MTGDDLAVVLPSLLDHLVGELAELMPSDLGLVHAGAQVAMVQRSGSMRTIATVTPSMPFAVMRDQIAAVAAGMMRDVQDLVVMHLRTPWPSVSGAPAHVSVRVAEGDRLVPVLLSSDGELSLREFRLPDHPSASVVAG